MSPELVRMHMMQAPRPKRHRLPSPQRPGAWRPGPGPLPAPPHHPQARLPQAAPPGGLRRGVCGARPEEGLPHDQHCGAAQPGGHPGGGQRWWWCVCVCVGGGGQREREGSSRSVQPLAPPATHRTPASAPSAGALAPEPVPCASPAACHPTFTRSWTPWICSTPSAPASCRCASWPPTCCAAPSRSTLTTRSRMRPPRSSEWWGDAGAGMRLEGCMNRPRHWERTRGSGGAECTGLCDARSCQPKTTHMVV